MVELCGKSPRNPARMADISDSVVLLFDGVGVGCFGDVIY